MKTRLDEIRKRVERATGGGAINCPSVKLSDATYLLCLANNLQREVEALRSCLWPHNENGLEPIEANAIAREREAL